MYYIWTIASNYPNSCWLQYDWENNPDYLQFLENKKVDIDCEILLYLKKKANKSTFLKFDYIMSDAIPLVSEKLSNIIIKHTTNEVQLIRARVLQDDNFIGNYHIPIILNIVDCINKKESIYDKEIGDFTKITFKPNSLKENLIVKAKGYDSDNIVVQESFVSYCSKEKIKGIEFYKEPFINPLYQ